MFSNPAAAGKIVHLFTALRRRSTTVSTGGAGGGFGGRYLTNLSRVQAFQTTLASTVQRFVRIGLPMAEKGGKGSGYRTLAWRSDHENTRPNRWLRACCGFLAYARKCRGHLRCPLASCRFTTCAAVISGQRLRRKQPAQHIEITGNRGRYPVKTQPKTRHSL